MTHVLPQLRRCPLALAVSLLFCGPVWAAITTAGDVGMGPVNLGLGPSQMRLFAA